MAATPSQRLPVPAAAWRLPAAAQAATVALAHVHWPAAASLGRGETLLVSSPPSSLVPTMLTAPPSVEGEIAAAPPPPRASDSSSAPTNTLDEPVLTTIARDLRMVARKLRVVLLPLNSSSEGGGSTSAAEGAGAASTGDAASRTLGELREWDLWGPLLLCLALSTVLSLSASVGQSAVVFASVFAMVWLGAAVVTVNAYLLGADMCVSRRAHGLDRAWRFPPPVGEPPPTPTPTPSPPRPVPSPSTPLLLFSRNCSSFFQSLCVLGYCIFPLVLAALVCFLVSNSIVRTIVIISALVWATRGTRRRSAAPRGGGGALPSRRTCRCGNHSSPRPLPLAQPRLSSCPSSSTRTRSCSLSTPSASFTPSLPGWLICSESGGRRGGKIQYLGAFDAQLTTAATRPSAVARARPRRGRARPP